jgi:hypothetical protein
MTTQNDSLNQVSNLEGYDSWTANVQHLIKQLRKEGAI